MEVEDSYITLCGVRLRTCVGAFHTPHGGTPSTPLISTPTTLSNLSHFCRVLGLSRGPGGGGRPILVEGPSGCGKTSIVRHVAGALGAAGGLVELHLDDTSDGKTLLGSFSCTDIPGKFEWRAGAVTTAALTGRWVLIEDVDRAPFDVLAALAPLLESRTLVLPGKPKALAVHPDFQIICTRTSASPGGAIHGAFGSYEDLMLRVQLVGMQEGGGGSGGESELSTLLHSLHPGFPEPLHTALLAAHSTLAALIGSGSGGGGGSPEDRATLTALVSSSGRRLTPRDTLKWASRISRLSRLSHRVDISPSAAATTISSSSSSSSPSLPVFITEEERLDMVREGVAVFGGHAPKETSRRALARCLATLWGLSPLAADAMVDEWRPSVEYSNTSSSSSSSSSFSSPTAMALSIGSIALPVSPQLCASIALEGRVPHPLPPSFVPTRHALCTLERLAASVAMGDPVLLVGETGTGKTSVIQALAGAVGARFLVYNLNVQSDSGDLLGGYKPVRMKQMAIPLYNRFEGLFLETFPPTPGSTSASGGGGGGSAFLAAVKGALHGEQWARFIGGMMKAVLQVEGGGGQQQHTTQLANLSSELKRAWQSHAIDVRHFERQFSSSSSSSSQTPGEEEEGGSGSSKQQLAFSFMEGILIDALRSGAWILLDEINLAGGEMLQRLAGLLDGGSITLTERGDSAPVPRHPSFRVFAAMNPATDFGKRDLPASLRSRFSEQWVGEVEDAKDLSDIVSSFVSKWPLHATAGNAPVDAASLVSTLVKVYLEARRLSAPITGVLRDGAASRPRFSLRTLTRALHSARVLLQSGFPPLRAVYEGLSMAFLTQLEAGSAGVLGGRIVAALTPLAGPPKSKGALAAAAAEAAAAAAAASGAVGGGKRPRGGANASKKAEDGRAAGDGGGSESSPLTGLAACNLAFSSDPSASLFGVEPQPTPFTTSSSSSSSSSSTTTSTHGLPSMVRVIGFSVPCGPLPPYDPAAQSPPGYVLVPSSQRHLRNLARAVLCSTSPVLLEGPTSAGKTSMVEYLAAVTGHRCVRINNHEHTDMSEYLGSYITEASTGKLVFSEGLLVKALREGSWLILDELNLAPSEVLEALNRLLDDNRELYVPETQEVVRPHPTFALFATQNPAGVYGGRKPLSQALRNRFVELHMEDIPPEELVTILTTRARLPLSFAQRMVAVMEELQRLRASSHVFAGKDGFITPRDLLRWAARRPTTYMELAEEGYMLLAERLKEGRERDAVKGALEKALKVALDVQGMYDKPFAAFLGDKGGGGKEGEGAGGSAGSGGDGEGGGAKATKRAKGGDGGPVGHYGEGDAEELKRKAFDDRVQSRLTSFLSRIHTTTPTPPPPPAAAAAAAPESMEGGSGAVDDLTPGCIPGTEGLGGITLTSALRRLFKLLGRCIACNEAVLLVGPTGTGKTTVVQLFSLLLAQPLTVLNCHAHTETADILGSQRPMRSSGGGGGGGGGGNGALFEWVDGPLVKSMVNGGFFLLDEASLAEDAVLERLNSVLEPGRSLTLAEKGGDTATALVTAHPDFRIFATMNPGGDFGKRDLSPALRNRFTEVWVPALDDLGDLRLIIASKAAEVCARNNLAVATTPSPTPSIPTQHPLSPFITPMLDFIAWFDGLSSARGGAASQGAKPVQFTLRDVHAWLGFMGSVLSSNATTAVSSSSSSSSLTTFQPLLSPWEVYAHGACIVLLDGLGLGTGMSLASSAALKRSACEYLLGQAPGGEERGRVEAVLFPTTSPFIVPASPSTYTFHGNTFGVAPFFIPLGSTSSPKPPSFSLNAPTARSNMLRVLRGMQHGAKPILLEGSPGVGKTSLIEALAKASGNTLVRINLSDQSDLADLFGQDLPIPPTPAAAGEGSSSSASAMPSSSSSSSPTSHTSPGFRWCDGVFLAALKAGSWVLLDELNLAPQAVLEGLNAVLDHRGVCYIPDLDLTFSPPPSFRVFATQNPVTQGGGRRGLPRSFLNRFVKVYLDSLLREDQLAIATSLFPALNTPLFGGEGGGSVTPPSPTTLSLMVDFNLALLKDTTEVGLYGSEGGPWDFNLRDLFRWAELVVKAQEGPPWSPHAFIDAVYLQRLRKGVDRVGAYTRFLHLWWEQGGGRVGGVGHSPALLAPLTHVPTVTTSKEWVAVGDVCLPRSYLPGVWGMAGFGDDATTLGKSRGEGILEALVGGGGRVRGGEEGLSSPSFYHSRGACITRYLVEEDKVPGCSGMGSTLLSSSPPPLPLALHRPLYHVSRAVSSTWPVLLVGPPSSGKTAIVTTLAKLVGARLRHISLTPSTDATELLGCFEQRGDGHGEEGEGEEEVEGVGLLFDSAYGMALGLASVFALPPPCAEEVPHSEKQYSEEVKAALGALNGALLAVSQRRQKQGGGTESTPFFPLLLTLLSTTTALATHLPAILPPLPPTLISTFTASLAALTSSAASHQTAPSTPQRGGFTWVDGVLIEAMERGEWVVIEDVNLCAPAVVDRLNPLLEPGGEVLIAECGPHPVTGLPRRVRPHPSFRIFFTLNAAQGEVSRALRNRCLEISLPDPAVSAPAPAAPAPVAPRPTLTGDAPTLTSLAVTLQGRIFEGGLPTLPPPLAHALNTVREALLAPFKPTTIDLAMVCQRAITPSTSLPHLLSLAALHKSIPGARPRALQYFCELAFTSLGSGGGGGNGGETFVPSTLSALSVSYPSIESSTYKGLGGRESLKARTKECASLSSSSSSSSSPTTASFSPLPATLLSDKITPALPILLASPFSPSQLQQLEALCDLVVPPSSAATTPTPSSSSAWVLGVLEALFSWAAGDGSDLVSRCEAAVNAARSFTTPDTLARVQGAVDALKECCMHSQAAVSVHTLTTSLSTTSPYSSSLLPLSTLGFPWGGGAGGGSSSTPMGEDDSVWSKLTPELTVRGRLMLARGHLETCQRVALLWGWVTGGVECEILSVGGGGGEDTVHSSLLCAAISLAFRRGWVPKSGSSSSTSGSGSGDECASATFAALLSSHPLLPSRDLEAVSECAGWIPALWSLCDTIIHHTAEGSPALHALRGALETLLAHLTNVQLALTKASMGGRVVTGAYLKECPAPVGDEGLEFVGESGGRETLASHLSAASLLWRGVVKATLGAWSTLFHPSSPADSNGGGGHNLAALFMQASAGGMATGSMTFFPTSSSSSSSSSSSQPSSGAGAQPVSQEEHLIKAALTLPRDVLWKYGGHPSIPRTQGVYKALECILSSLEVSRSMPIFLPCGAALASGEGMGGGASSTSPPLTGLLALFNDLHQYDLLPLPHKLHLLSLLGVFEAAGGSLRKDASPALYLTLSSEAMASTQALIQSLTPSDPLGPALPIPDYLENAPPPFDSSAMDMETELGIPPSLLNRLSAAPHLPPLHRRALRRSMASPLVASVSSWCLEEERSVHGSVAQVIAGVGEGEGGHAGEGGGVGVDLAHLATRTSRLLTLASAATAWCVTALTPLQSLLWALEGTTGTDLTRHLSNVFPALEASWWARREGLAEGFLFGGASTSTSTSTSTRPSPSSPSLHEYEVHVNLLATLSGHLATNAHGSKAPSGGSGKGGELRLPYTLALCALLSVFTSSQASMGIKGRGGEGSVCAAFQSTTRQWYKALSEGVQEGGAKEEEEAVISHETALCDFCLQVPDARVVASVRNGSMGRALGGLRGAWVSMERMGEGGEEEVTPASRLAVATAALRVHALRFTLLLPTSPVDPALKPRLKGFNALSARTRALSSLHLRQCVSTLQGGVSSLDTVVESLEATGSSLKASAVAYFGKASFRPPPSPPTPLSPKGVADFHQYYAEATRFSSSLVTPQRLEAIEAGFASSLSTSAGGEGGGEGGGVGGGGEVPQWASSLTAFAQRLHSAYTTSAFGDVASPLESAVWGMVGAVNVLFNAPTSPFLNTSHSPAKGVTASPTAQKLALVELSLLNRGRVGMGGGGGEKEKESGGGGRLLGELIDNAAEFRGIDAAGKLAEEAAKKTGVISGEVAVETSERMFREVIPDFYGVHFKGLLPPPPPSLGSSSGSGDMGTSSKPPQAPSSSTPYNPRHFHVLSAYLRMWRYGGEAEVAVDLPGDGWGVNIGGESSLRLLACPTAPLATSSPLPLFMSLQYITAPPLFRPAPLPSSLTSPTAPKNSKTATEAAAASSSWSFYTSPSTAEAVLCLPPVRALASRALQILRLFPRNEILCLLLRVCGQVLSLRCDAPLAAYLTGCELCLTKGSEWDASAPKDLGLGATLTKLGGLVSRWRKLELSSWGGLVKAEEREAEGGGIALDLFSALRAVALSIPLPTVKAAAAASAAAEVHPPPTAWAFQPPLSSHPLSHFSHAQWGAQLLATPSTTTTTTSPGNKPITAGEGDPEEVVAYLKGVFECGDKFLRGATLGSFSYRIQLVCAVAREVMCRAGEGHPSLKAATKHPLGVARSRLHSRASLLLSSLASYYSQYQGAVVRELGGGKDPLMQRVKDQVKLHRWDEQSYYARMESAEKAHRIVYKAVEEYRVLLGGPVAPVLDAWAPGAGGGHSSTSSTATAKQQSAATSSSSPSTLTSYLVPSMLTSLRAPLLSPLAVVAHSAASSSSSSSSSSSTTNTTTANTYSSRLSEVRSRMATLLTSSTRGLFHTSRVQSRSEDTGCVESLASYVFDTCTALAAPTASRMMKKRGLTDTMRRLERAGLSPLASKTTQAARDPFLLSQLPTLSFLSASHRLRSSVALVGSLVGCGGPHPTSSSSSSLLPTLSSLDTSDAYLQGVQDQLARIRMRVISGACHKDVSAVEVRKSVGLCEHLLGLTLAQRCGVLGGVLALDHLASGMVGMQKLVGCLEGGGLKGAGEGEASGNLPTTTTTTTTTTSPLWLPTSTRHFKSLLTRVSSLTESLRGCAARATAAKSLLKTLARTMTGEALSQSPLSRDNVMEEAALLGIVAVGGVEEGYDAGLLPEVLKARMAVVVEVEGCILSGCQDLEALLSALVAHASVSDGGGNGGVVYPALIPFPPSMLASVQSAVAAIHAKVSSLLLAPLGEGQGTPSTSSPLLSIFMQSVGEEVAKECEGATNDILQLSFSPPLDATTSSSRTSSSSGGVGVALSLATPLPATTPSQDDINAWERAVEVVVTSAMACIQGVVPKEEEGSKMGVDGGGDSGGGTTFLWGFAPRAPPPPTTLGVKESKEGELVEDRVEAEVGVEEEQEDTTLPDIPAVSTMAFHTLSKLSDTPLSRALTTLSTLTCRVFGGTPTPTTLSTALPKLKGTLSLLAAIGCSLASMISESVELHRATCKLALVSSSTLLRLLRDGYCGVGDKDGEGEGEGEGEAGGQGGKGSQGGGQFQAGTGIGEGVGMEDVSQEMENEGQVLGLKGEGAAEEKGEEQPKGDGKKKDKGVEMSTDFEGEEGDMEEEEEEEEGGGEGEEDEGEELDREMGKADGKDAAIVDEKLWDKEENKEEEEGEGGKDNKEAQAPEKSQHAVKGGKKKGDGMRSAEGGEGGKDDDLDAGGGEEEAEEGNEPNADAAKEEGGEGEGEGGDSKEQEGELKKEEKEREKEEEGGKMAKPKGELEVDSDDEALKEEEGGKLPKRDETVGHKDEREGEEGEEEEEEGAGEEEEEGAGEGGMEEEGGGEGGREDALPPSSDDPDFVIPQDLSIDDGEKEDERGGQDDVGDDGMEEEVEGRVEPVGVGVEGEEGETKEEDASAPPPPPLPPPPNQSLPPNTNTATQGLSTEGGSDRVQNNAPEVEPQGKAEESGRGEEEGEEGKTGEEENEEGGAMDEDFTAGEAGGEDRGGGDDDNQMGGGSKQESSKGGGSWRVSQQQQGQQGSKEHKPTSGHRPLTLPPKAKKSNPLLVDPEKALRQWQANFRNSKQEEEEEEGGGGIEERAAAGDNAPPSSSFRDLDVIAGSGENDGSMDMLAPADKRGEEEGEEEEKKEGKEEEVIPSTTVVDDMGEGGGGDMDEELKEGGGGEREEGEGEGDGEEEEEVKVKAALPSMVKPLFRPPPKGSLGPMEEEEDEEGEEGEEEGEDDIERRRQASNQAILDALADGNALKEQGGGSNPTLFINTATLASASSSSDPPPLSMLSSMGGDDGEGVEGMMTSSSSSSSSSSGESAWRTLCGLTSDHASRLCENLRLVLEPTKASKLGGEYRSGKRINMRRVIPYIASNFRKDKIWQRRSRPSSRTYQILLAVDDSSSMAPGNRGGGTMALQSLAVIARALSRLEVGEVGVMSFGSTVRLLHPLGTPFTDESGAHVLSSFTFAQEGTKVEGLMEAVVGVMGRARASPPSASGGGGVGAHKFLQLAFVISDGILGGGAERERIRQWAIEAQRAGVLLVCVIVDKGGGEECDSITQTQSIQFVNGAVVRTAYLDEYPLPLYTIIKDIQALPEVLSDAVRQFFEIMG